MVQKPFVKVTEAAQLLPGENLSIPSPNAKNHKSIIFEGTILEIGQLILSHGVDNPWCSGYLVVDAATVSVYEYPGEAVLARMYEHGLGLSGPVSIRVQCNGGFTAALEICSPSGSFRQQILWNGSNGDIRVDFVASRAKNCRLTYRIDGLSQDLWMFGDSYFDFWPRNLVAEGHSNFYMDGYSGRDSINALRSLEICLQYATPKTILWFMGMNDPDGTEVNTSWYHVYCTLADLCRSKGIALIPVTVPNVPDRNHRYKNQIIRNDGLPYIDLCRALGAEESVFWHAGLLGEDHVHPTEALGSAAIAKVVQQELTNIKEKNRV